MRKYVLEKENTAERVMKNVVRIKGGEFKVKS